MILLVLLLAAPVQFDIHFMPPGTPYTLQSGEVVRYFKFEEFKTLLKMDAELWRFTKDTIVFDDLELKYSGIITQKDNIIKTLNDDKSLLDERLKRCDEHWHLAEDELVKASGGPIWPYFLAAGGAALAIVGVTLFVVSRLPAPALSLPQAEPSQNSALRPLGWLSK